MRTFKIDRSPYDFKLFKKDEITFNEGITVLVGCNGSGKSTLINQIQCQLEKDKNVIVLTFDNLKNGGDRAKNEASYKGNYELLLQAMFSSEGENILLNLGEFARKIGELTVKEKNKKETWFILDAVDSGLSIDNIMDVKDVFKFIANDQRKGDRKIYIIISANSYEFAYGEKCFNVSKFKYENYPTYTKYKSAIIQSKKLKDKRDK